jgi:hypothetical protein
MSQLEVDKVIPQSGTTLTLGDSADTITIPSGATLDATNATVTYPAGSITDAAISSTAAIQQSKISGSPGFRNIVINGNMQLAQRSTSVASITADGYYTVDRFKILMTTAGTWTQSQSTDVPTGQGFATSLKMDCTTANGSLSANSRILIAQSIEGQNLQYLKKGTANAVSTTLSFWVKSTKTGTFIAELFDVDNQRQISASYTVNTTNTWENKTITFEGDTTGTLDNNNGNSFQLSFYLSAGTDYIWNFIWINTQTQTEQLVKLIVQTTHLTIGHHRCSIRTQTADFEFLPVGEFYKCQYFRTVVVQQMSKGAHS